MVNVLIKSDSHHKVDRARIKKTVESFLSQRKVKGNIEVSISIVGDRMMKKLNKKYRGIDETTDVLSFSQIEQAGSQFFVPPPDDVLRLGDIVISYPQAIEEAIAENKMVDDKIDELITHGLKHLFGNHHE